MSDGPISDSSRNVFIASLFLLIAGGAFGLGLYAAARENFVFVAMREIWRDINLVYEELPNRGPNAEPIHFMQPVRQQGDGVTINQRQEDDSLVLLAGFFDGSNGIQLIRRDGSLVARWPVRFYDHFSDVSHMRRPPATDLNIDLHGALVNPDGSVVFNYESGGTVKLSRCGETVWTLKHPTHHSIERAEGGGYWILGRNNFERSDGIEFPPFTRKGNHKDFQEDLILRVSEEGEIEWEKSIPRILYDNGLEPLMTATGYSFRVGGTWESELVHSNKVGELRGEIADAFETLDQGDLVLSLRQYNLILVVDPDNWQIKWHQIGPWRRQHDPEFNPDGTITIFNNNTYRTDLGARDRTILSTPRVSNIIKVDPATGATSVVYGGLPGQEFLSVVRGKHDLTADGGVLVTEFEAGRAFEVDSDGTIVWEYINRRDQDFVYEMTETRLYPQSYFNVDNWSCSDNSR